MSDEDPTKELPSVPDTEPTMYTVMERLNGLDEHLTARLTTMDGRLTTMDGRLTTMDGRLTTMDERLTTMDERLTTMDERLTTMDERLTTVDERLTTVEGRLTTMHESADRRHSETNANFRRVEDKMDILHRRMLDWEANHVDLRRRVEELETKAS